MADDYRERHAAARATPTGDELLLVALLHVIDVLSKRYASDHVLRAGVADLLTGTRTLLNGQWGDRLDMGSCDSELVKAADRISFNMDVEEFVQ